MGGDQDKSLSCS